MGIHKAILPLVLMIFTSGARAQVFEVASVRPHSPDDQRFGVKMPNSGRFSSTGSTAKLLIMLAFDLQESQIVGGPEWLPTEKWDIEAKSENARHTPEESRVMLQNLLADRFALQTHREMAERPVYALSTVKEGAKFKAKDVLGQRSLQITSNSIQMESGSTRELVQLLATALGRLVIDQTGLAGVFDLSVQWDDAPVREGGVPGLEVSVPPGSDRGSIFTALQNQLGLRLESKRAPVEIVVIDHASKPSPN